MNVSFSLEAKRIVTLLRYKSGLSHLTKLSIENFVMNYFDYSPGSVSFVLYLCYVQLSLVIGTELEVIGSFRPHLKDQFVKEQLGNFTSIHWGNVQVFLLW